MHVTARAVIAVIRLCFQSVKSDPTLFLYCFPDMTYNVFGGTLNLALSIYLFVDAVADALGGKRHLSR